MFLSSDRWATDSAYPCTTDLSAVYFDIRKDALYCDAPDSLRRRACRTVMDILFHRLTTWLAPVLVVHAAAAAIWLGALWPTEYALRSVDPKLDDQRPALVVLGRFAHRGRELLGGLAATGLMVLDKEGMLERYSPKGFDQIKDDFKDKRSGATDIPMTRSGYSLTRVVKAARGGKFKFTMTKKGAAVTANGVSSHSDHFCEPARRTSAEKRSSVKQPEST